VAAFESLGVLVDLYERGMREPLPVYCATSAAWAAAVRRGEGPAREARSRWASAYDEDQGECTDPEHELVLGRAAPFEQLLDGPPEEDETGPGWDSSEPSRFGRLALRLWGPVLGHEELTTR
jgi:exodeoxyribonuclease V gamma subunit